MSLVSNSFFEIGVSSQLPGENLFDEAKWEEMSTSGIFQYVRRSPHIEGEPTRLEGAKLRLQEIASKEDTFDNVNTLVALLKSKELFSGGQETWRAFWQKEIFARFSSQEYPDIYLDYAVLAHMNGMIDGHTVDLVFTHWTLKHYHKEYNSIEEHPLFVDGTINERMDQLLQARCFFQCFSGKYQIFMEQPKKRKAFYRRVQAESLSSEKTLLIAGLPEEKESITVAIRNAGFGMFTEESKKQLIWPSRMLQIFCDVFMKAPITIEPSFGAPAPDKGMRSSMQRGARPLVMRSPYQPISDRADDCEAKGIRQRQHDGYHVVIVSSINEKDRQLYLFFADTIHAKLEGVFAVSVRDQCYDMELAGCRPDRERYYRSCCINPNEENAMLFWTTFADALQNFISRTVKNIHFDSFAKLDISARKEVISIVQNIVQVIWKNRELCPEYRLSRSVGYIQRPCHPISEFKHRVLKLVSLSLKSLEAHRASRSMANFLSNN